MTEFDRCADAYESYRPGYPPELFDHLAIRFGLEPGAVVVDLGAGTGRASAVLADRGYLVIAVEPSAEMRAKGGELERRSGGRVRFVNGTAEDTGLDEGIADLIVCAQAFHWFDPSQALPEAARVLRPTAGLALFWNNRDPDLSPIGPELQALIARINPRHDPEYRSSPWTAVLERSGLFADIERLDFLHSVEMTCDTLCGLMRSISYVRNVLDAAAMHAFEIDVRAIVARHFGDATFQYAYRTELFAAERI